MKKILMALTLVGLIQVSAEAQTNCACKAKKHYTVKHHAVAQNMKVKRTYYGYRVMHVHPQIQTDAAMLTGPMPEQNVQVPVVVAKTSLQPDVFSAIGTPTVYTEKHLVMEGLPAQSMQDNTVVPATGRRMSACKSLTVVSNNRVRSFAGYRRHNIVVNDDMNNPYLGEPSRQNDGVKKNEYRNLNTNQSGMVLPGNDGSRP